MEISSHAAIGRLLAAGRMLAGLDQAELGQRAGVAGSTVSNVERGSEAREETLKAIRRALREEGITLTVDRTNGVYAATIKTEEPDDDD